MLAVHRESLVVDKRVVLQGEGGLGEAKIDQRTNSPGLRLGRSCLLMNLDVDMTGFREAARVEGPASVQPLLLSCILRCSCTSAAPMQCSALSCPHCPCVRHCQACRPHAPSCAVPDSRRRTCRCSGDDALQVAGQAGPVLQGCTLQGAKCGLRSTARAQALLLDTKVERCGQAGVQAMDCSSVSCSRHCHPSSCLAAPTSAPCRT